MKDFFDYDCKPDTPTAITSDARNLLERYNSLSKSKKYLLSAYLDGLQEIDVSEQE